MSRGRAAVILVAALALAGLTWVYLARPDPHDAFRAAVAAAPGCAVATDCAVLQTSCPLGCAHAVPRSAYDALAALAADHVRQSVARQGQCAQDCEAPPAVVCTAGRCAFVD
ncbi:MAG: hypothetical protein AAFU86_09685 [Pseudomonadota bacterium]